MDIQLVRNMAGDLDRAATEVDDVLRLLSRPVAEVPWTGPDANSFRSEWTGTQVKMLNSVVADLRSTGSQARANAEDQARASRSR
jgi:hypothetical protein